MCMRGDHERKQEPLVLLGTWDEFIKQILWPSELEAQNLYGMELFILFINYVILEFV